MGSGESPDGIGKEWIKFWVNEYCWHGHSMSRTNTFRGSSLQWGSLPLVQVWAYERLTKCVQKLASPVYSPRMVTAPMSTETDCLWRLLAPPPWAGHRKQAEIMHCGTWLARWSQLFCTCICVSFLSSFSHRPSQVSETQDAQDMVKNTSKRSFFFIKLLYSREAGITQ